MRRVQTGKTIRGLSGRWEIEARVRDGDLVDHVAYSLTFAERRAWPALAPAAIFRLTEALIRDGHDPRDIDWRVYAHLPRSFYYSTGASL